MENVFVKVCAKNHIKSEKCYRCGELAGTSEREFYHGKYDKKYRCKFVCENCLTDNDYCTLSTGYYSKSDTEVFHLLNWHWNIDEMYKYAVEKGIRKISKTTEELKQWNMSNFVTIDEGRLDKVDMSKPCIMVNLSQVEKQYMVVDGNHRIRKAINDGLEFVEFYLFEFKEQFKFLMWDEFEFMQGMVDRSLKARG